MCWLSCFLALAVPSWETPADTRPEPARKDPPFTAEVAQLRAEAERLVAARLKELEKEYEAAKTDADRRAIRQQLVEAQHRSGARRAAKIVALVRPHAAYPASVHP